MNSSNQQTQTQTQTQPQTETQTDSQDKKIMISPIQLLVNAVLVAYQRNAYTMQEAGLISQAIDFFTVKTNQAKLPDIKEESEKEEVKEETQNQEKPIMLSQ
jgi:hypothetical protein